MAETDKNGFGRPLTTITVVHCFLAYFAVITATTELSRFTSFKCTSHNGERSFMTKLRCTIQDMHGKYYASSTFQQ